MINKTIKKNANNKHIKKQKYRLKKLTVKNNNTKNHSNHKSQKGGNSDIKEKFEIQSLNNFDFDKYRISKYVDANIEWGSMPGVPPEPNCCIL